MRKAGRMFLGSLWIECWGLFLTWKWVCLALSSTIEMSKLDILCWLVQKTSTHLYFSGSKTDKLIKLLDTQ